MSNDSDAADPSANGAGSPTAELRRDRVTGNAVLVNPARSGRPFTVAATRPGDGARTSDLRPRLPVLLG